MDEMTPSNCTHSYDYESGPSEALMNPLLLAAYHGNSEVLKTLLRFYDAKEKEMLPFAVVKKLYRKSMYRNVLSDSLLNVHTEDTKENILHLVLKGPYIHNSSVSNLEF